MRKKKNFKIVEGDPNQVVKSDVTQGFIWRGGEGGGGGEGVFSLFL